MLKRKIVYGILISLLTLSFILGGIVLYSVHSKELRVVFLDVGQGDAILISQGSSQILVDGGKNEKVLLEKLGKFIPFWDRQIEAVVATHPDSDHIGGLVGVLGSYRVKSVVETKVESESETYKTWKRELENSTAHRVEALKGMKIKFPKNSAEAEIIYPFDSESNPSSKSTNDNSVVMKIIFGENSFLLTGDLPDKNERKLTKNSLDLRADVLKVAHHGSKYSTTEDFLKNVKPKEAVISVGKNKYGHPSEDVLRRLKKYKVRTKRTDEEGDIVYKCKNQNEKCRVVF